MNITNCQSQIFRNLNNNLGTKFQYSPIFRGCNVREDTFQLTKNPENTSQKPGTKIFKNSDGEVLENMQSENGFLKTENGDLFTGTIETATREGTVYDGYKDGELIAKLEGNNATYYKHTSVPHVLSPSTKRTDAYTFDINTGKVIGRKTTEYDENGNIKRIEQAKDMTLSVLNSNLRYSLTKDYFEEIKSIFNLD